MQHIFAITESQLKKVNIIASHKFDGEFTVLSRGETFSDIAQWSDKYQNVKILTVPTQKLNWNDCVD